MYIVYKPYPAQKLLHECPYVEVLLEGNRGGGKSDGAIMDYLSEVGNGWKEAWQGIIFRRQIKDLNDLIKKSKKYIVALCPNAIFNISTRTWKFPDGETLTFQQADRDDDYWNFHGHEYPWQFFDELTSWASPDFYLSMASCCRSGVKGIPKRRLSATNPWGAGHSWVKKRFIDPAPRMKPITDIVINPVTDEEIEMTRVAINCQLKDNKHLIENDPVYIAQLNSITNEAKRKAWIDGDWSIQVGAFFGDVWSDKNIIKPFTPPKHWLKFCGFDWGYAKPFAMGWFCISDGTELPDGRIYPVGSVIKYREYYGCEDNEEDVGVRLTVEEIADGIHNREDEDISYRVADPALFKEDGGESQAERFHKKGITFERADNQRVAGWELMRERMKGTEVAKDKWVSLYYVFDTCLHTIRTIPILLHDEKKLEDIDTTMEDHIADADRYALNSRPWIKKNNSNRKSDTTFTDALDTIQTKEFF